MKSLFNVSFYSLLIISSLVAQNGDPWNKLDYFYDLVDRYQLYHTLFPQEEESTLVADPLEDLHVREIAKHWSSDHRNQQAIQDFNDHLIYMDLIFEEHMKGGTQEEQYQNFQHFKSLQKALSNLDQQYPPSKESNRPFAYYEQQLEIRSKMDFRNLYLYKDIIKLAALLVDVKGVLGEN